MIARLVVSVLMLAACVARAQDGTIVVGSKKFTESVILGEMVTQLLRDAGYDADHRRDMGGSRVLFEGLIRGDLDAYPDYTGTIRHELLSGLDLPPDADLAEVLAREHGLAMTKPLGFNNTYAVGVTRATAERYGLRTISDLRAHAGLVLGFSNEFMDREDGWPGLRTAYGLTNPARGMDHDLAYRGLESGDIQAMDLYATDAEIAYYDLVVLEDDRAYFPRYDAVILYRMDLAARAPAAAEAIERLAGSIDAHTMSAMNRRAKIGDPAPGGPDAAPVRIAEAIVAQDFLAERFGITSDARVETRRDILWRTTREHVTLVAWSMAAALLVAIPLGVIAAKVRGAGAPILWAVGILQTMPALALLVLLIPLFGLDAKTAIVALFLYSLLPIVRNTYAGLTGIPGDVAESAVAIGLTARQRLLDVELPLALPTILAGVKTAAVINVGTATLAALIGVGGYGQPILTGIRLDDFGLILLGAGPAALMAIGVQLLFDLAERLVVSRGLRL